jgi:uncharacterized protein
MTIEQIQSIVDLHRFPGEKVPTELIETHISWVILAPEFVYKIKKPVQFSFLDFSTLEKRAFYCREELKLNRRLAPDMYLDVLPVILMDDSMPEIGAKNGVPLDYALQMKRMDNSRQMDKLLLQNAVTEADMKALAALLSAFHQSVAIPGGTAPYNAADNRDDFDDLFRLEAECVALFGAGAAEKMRQWRQKVGMFLDGHERRLQERARSGFWVDGHGDLHGRNIFLLPEGPLVFDCIEFNPHFRKLDVLNELAFLCMDLDAGGHHELAQSFMDLYSQHWCCIENREDQNLFHYFKAYRANVRLKVTIMAWQQHPTPELEQTASIYWHLLHTYIMLLGT